MGLKWIDATWVDLPSHKSLGRNYQRLKDIRAWIEENVKGEHYHSMDRPFRYAFMDPEDALLFKITWC